MCKLKDTISSLFLVCIFFGCSNGQVKTNLPEEPVAEKLSFTSRQPKLIKTQGSNQYQNVHCSLQDKDGNLWFGTTGEGVYRYDGKIFTQFTEKDGLSSNAVWCVMEDRLGNIWFGTGKGISRYDGKTVSTISANNTTASAGAVWSMFQDKNGMIWLGTDNGIDRYDGKKMSHFLDDPTIINKTGLTLKSVQCMFEDKNGNLWFGSGPLAFEGICVFDGKSLTGFKPQKEEWIRKITQDKNGTLLLATRHVGLIGYDGKSFSDYSKPEALRKELLTGILVDSKGNIWYGSDYTNNSDVTTGGLWKFDGESFVEFTKKDGLGNTSIYSITEDKAGNIWIGTRNTGLYRYDGKNFISLSE